jgi:hypothetical protein
VSSLDAAPSRALGRTDPGAIAKTAGVSAADLVAIGVLLAVALVLPLVVGAISGSLDVPRNDDWSYRGIALRLFQTGRLELDGAVQAASLGLAIAVQPLLGLAGGAWWAFLVAGILFDALTVAAGYLLLRRVVEPRLAALGIGLVVIFPAWLPYSVSFMSDVPALGAQLTCLLLGAVALERQRTSGRWLLASLVVGLFGYSVREFALAAPAAVLAAALIREPRRVAPWAGLIGTAGTIAGLFLLRSSLPGVAGAFGPEPAAIVRIVPALCTLGLVLSPATLLAIRRWRRQWRPFDVALGAGIVVSLLVVQLAHLATSPEDRRLIGGSFPYVLLYDLISQWGAPAADYLIGRRPLLVPTPVWIAVGGSAIAAVVLLGAVAAGTVGAAVRRARADWPAARRAVATPAGLLAIHATGTVAGIVVYGSTWTLFDRYLWPIVPPVAALLLRGLGAGDTAAAGRADRDDAAGKPRLLDRLSVLGAAGQLVLLAGLSTAFLLNADAFDAARWRAAEVLVGRGYEAKTIDAGPEWVGSHPSGLATAAAPLPNALTWWQSWWPDFRMCAFVASAPQADSRYRLLDVRENAYRLYLVVGAAKPLYLYAVDDPACPHPGQD